MIGSSVNNPNQRFSSTPFKVVVCTELGSGPHSARMATTASIDDDTEDMTIVSLKGKSSETTSPSHPVRPKHSEGGRVSTCMPPPPPPLSH